ncbi:MAG: hypothetical protein KJO05_12060 [Bacteroidia bacterium]|nr:hypothetical protein [Bacteroidia bacterium]NNF31793.1 hypothetical protein [Flavobacteriaceae bacterium]MBT8276222.1 hypothetical protein [Bacteroidia bacterium]NNJ83041.1 hypothetical protein [Flavobacteriaceae bacterium]NNK53368.1 hypothetical protein [Flavobacteriaceae bacterium]
MKKNLFISGILSVLMFSLVFTSCSKDEATEVETSNNSDLVFVEESQEVSKADAASDGVIHMLETAYTEIEEDSGRTVSLFPDCVTITLSSENGVTFVTLDFGFGCELQNGAVVSGIVNITYGPVQNGTRTITYTFQNFTWNGNEVAGGATIFRERNNANGNPQSTVHADLQISFQGGLVLQKDGTRVREWIEGVGSGTWTDNVWLVTGNREVNSNTGFSHYGIITEALRREATCPHFVSGIVEITRNGNQGILNFGDGTCDNIAILTVNGVDYTIILN